MLAELLPVEVGNTASTLRRRTLRVGQRLENEHPPIEKNTNSEAIVAVGLDSGYVRDCCPDAEWSFEVVVGRLCTNEGGSSSLGFVRQLETTAAASNRLKQRLKEQGMDDQKSSVILRWC